MTLFAGRYEVERELGHGASAVVYLARDREHDRSVALKVLHADLAESIGARLFLQEIHVTARLQHVRILSVLDAGEWEGQLYLVTPYMEGGSLRERLQRERQLPIGVAVAVAHAVATALHHAHTHGVVHRDVKPANILFSGDEACLADFGIARAADRASGVTTSTGLARGTPAYMSPEQAAAEREIDGRSDVYALGCVLYEMLAGVLPFAGATAQAMLAQRFKHTPDPVSRYRETVPPELDAIVARALQREPADRFQTAREMAEALVATGLVHSTGATAVRRNAEATAVGAGSAHGQRLDRRHIRTIAGIALLAAVSAGTYALTTGGSSAHDRDARLDTSSVLTVRVEPRVDATAAGDGPLSDRVRQALSAELVGWPEVRLANPSTSSAAIALSVSAVPLGDSAQVLVDIVGPGTAVARRRIVRVVPLDSAGAASTAGVLVRQVLAGPAADSTPGLDAMPGRSLSALRDYVGGWRDLRAGRLDSASARFRSSLQASPRFAHAALWAAQSAAWANPADGRAWRVEANVAVGARTLTGADSVLAVAVRALSVLDYPTACAAYRELTLRDPASFAGWFGLGECERLDPVVVRTPAGLRFRSSHWAAVRAYLEAVERSPTPDLLAALSQRVMRLTYAAGNRARAGLLEGSSTEQYVALPSLDADTLAFHPIPRAESEQSSARSVPATYEAAIRRARSVALELTERWVRRAPRSAEAWLQRAFALELVGRITSGPEGPSAMDALDRGAALARSELGRARVAVARTRIALRRADFDLAAKTARRSIDDPLPQDTLARRELAPLAALVGDARRTEELATFDRGSTEALPAQLTDSVRRFHLRAVLGACAGLKALRAALDTSFARRFAPAELAIQRVRLLRASDYQAVPCLGPNLVARYVPTDPLEVAYDAIARGDLAAARRALGALKPRRAGATVASVTWDVLFAESWALTQAGDTLATRAQLLAALSNISDMNMNTLDHPEQAAGLRRAIELLHAIHAEGSPARTWLRRAEALVLPTEPRSAR